MTRGSATERARAEHQTPFAHTSRRAYWLDRPDISAPPRRSTELDRRTDVDLVVIGAGFTGLWAAIEAARSGRGVLVVDRGRVGHGASGRCGGFVNASITHGIGHGHSRWPDQMDRIVALQHALWTDTLDELAAIGAGSIIQPVGKTTVATRPHQLADLAAAVDVLRRYGQDVELLDIESLARRVASPTYLGGYHLASDNGLCDPARLAWALSELAERAGASIVEGHDVASIRGDGDTVIVRTSEGATVRAGRVLLATNAAAPLLRRLRAWVIPVYDHVIVTEPLSPDQRRDIGWSAAEGVTDAGNQFHYYRLTPDGGILFGGWDATYHFGSRVDPRFEDQPPTHQLLYDHLVETFPGLRGIPVTHAWGGAIDSTSRFTPTFGTALGGRVGWAVGFTGLGVGASRFAALAALDLLLERRTERTELDLVRRAPIPFPPEPMRWLVVGATKRALQREDRTGRRGLWLRTLDRFGVGFDT